MFDFLRDRGLINEKVLIGFLVLLLLAGGVWRSGLLSSSALHRSPVTETGLLREEGEPADEEENLEELITIHLVGEVKNPGVYQLPSGSRVYQLLDLAGGFKEEADETAVNLARPLIDGEQVVVYRAGESAVNRSGEPASSDGKININLAGADELTSLPGIGEVRAKQIVAHREQHGFFNDPQELMDVSGIGEKTYENIAGLITIY